MLGKLELSSHNYIEIVELENGLKMDAEQRQKLIEGIFDFSDAMMRLSTRQSLGELLHSELTMTQMKVIGYLGAVRPDGANMSELAKALGVGLSTSTGIIDRLVEQGIVERREDTADRRYVLIQLSAKGQEQFEALNQGYRQPISDMLNAMSDDELKQIAAALGTLRQVIENWVERQDQQNGATQEQSQQQTN